MRSLCSYAIAPRTAPPAALNLYAATAHAFDDVADWLITENTPGRRPEPAR